MRALSKVPEVTILFWIIKVLCTTVGETAADFLNTNLHLGLTGTTVVMSALLAAVLVAQFRLRSYVPGVYWLAVVLISVVGTLITDNLVDNLGVSLVACTAAFSVALAATFLFWFPITMERAPTAAVPNTAMIESAFCAWRARCRPSPTKMPPYVIE